MMAAPSWVPTASRCDLPWKSIEGYLCPSRRVSGRCRVSQPPRDNSRSDELVQDNRRGLVNRLSKIRDGGIERLDDGFCKSRQTSVED